MFGPIENSDSTAMPTAAGQPLSTFSLTVFFLCFAVSLVTKDPNESSWVLKSINIYHTIKFASFTIHIMPHARSLRRCPSCPFDFIRFDSTISKKKKEKKRAKRKEEKNANGKRKKREIFYVIYSNTFYWALRGVGRTHGPSKEFTLVPFAPWDSVLFKFTRNAIHTWVEKGQRV